MRCSSTPIEINIFFFFAPPKKKEKRRQKNNAPLFFCGQRTRAYAQTSALT